MESAPLETLAFRGPSENFFVPATHHSLYLSSEKKAIVIQTHLIIYNLFSNIFYFVVFGLMKISDCLHPKDFVTKGQK